MNTEQLTIETKRRGRPLVEGSVRQAKLAAQYEKVQNGGTISRGRPSNPSSRRQERLTAQAERAAAGILIKPGRPKVVKPIETEAILEVVA